jgi:hypothetical protein
MKADKEDSGPRRKSGETPRQSRTDFLRSQIFECGPAQPFINLSGLSCSLITQRVSNPGSHLERAGFFRNSHMQGSCQTFPAAVQGLQCRHSEGCASIVDTVEAIEKCTTFSEGRSTLKTGTSKV